MSNKTIDMMPVVKSEDVKPLYSSDEIVEKLAIAVNGMREMKGDPKQWLELELMYSLAIAIRDKTL